MFCAIIWTRIEQQDSKRTMQPFHFVYPVLKGLSHEIDFKNVDENGQILALLRAAAGFWIFQRLH